MPRRSSPRHRRTAAAALAVAAALALALAACGGPATPPGAPPSNRAATTAAPAPPVFGSYRAPHEIMVVCDVGDDGWCPEEVMDTMEVRDAGRGALAVTIELVQTNAHTCTFEGTLAPDPQAPGARWIYDGAGGGGGGDDGHDAETDAVGDGELDEWPCRLVLEHEPRSVRISSDGCRLYCGARATLDAVFSFPPGTD